MINKGKATTINVNNEDNENNFDNNDLYNKLLIKFEEFNIKKQQQILNTLRILNEFNLFLSKYLSNTEDDESRFKSYLQKEMSITWNLKRPHFLENKINKVINDDVSNAETVLNLLGNLDSTAKIIIKLLENSQNQQNTFKSLKPEKAEGMEKLTKSEKLEKLEKIEKIEKAEGNLEKAEKIEKAEKVDKVEKAVKTRQEIFSAKNFNSTITDINEVSRISHKNQIFDESNQIDKVNGLFEEHLVPDNLDLSNITNHNGNEFIENNSVIFNDDKNDGIYINIEYDENNNDNNKNNQNKCTLKNKQSKKQFKVNKFKKPSNQKSQFNYIKENKKKKVTENKNSYSYFNKVCGLNNLNTTNTNTNTNININSTTDNSKKNNNNNININLEINDSYNNNIKNTKKEEESDEESKLLPLHTYTLNHRTDNDPVYFSKKINVIFNFPKKEKYKSYQNSKESPMIFTLELKKYSPRFYFKALKCYIMYGHFFVYRYPYKCDTEEHLQKMSEFIVNHLQSYEIEITKRVTIFHLDIDENDKCNFIDQFAFRLYERQFLIKKFPGCITKYI